MQQCYNFRNNTDAITSSGAVDTESLQQLSELGYQVVINLLPDDNKSALAGEKEIIESQGVHYIHIPVDFDAPTEADYQQFHQNLQTILDKKIHIHCAANYRASAFFSIFAVDQNIWSPQQAYDFIATLWQPSQYPVWHQLLKQHGLNCN